MLSFEEGFIESQQLNQRLLQTIRLLGEYKGKQELFKQQAPQVLGTLRQAAVIQSTESSNRIESITVPLELRRERDAGRLECWGRGVEADWRKQ